MSVPLTRQYSHFPHNSFLLHSPTPSLSRRKARNPLLRFSAAAVPAPQARDREAREGCREAGYQAPEPEAPRGQGRGGGEGRCLSLVIF
jgi:hypothetical protein